MVSLWLAEMRLTLNFNDVKSCNEAAVRDSDSALNSLNVTIPERFVVASFRIIHLGVFCLDEVHLQTRRLAIRSQMLQEAPVDVSMDHNILFRLNLRQVAGFVDKCRVPRWHWYMFQWAKKIDHADNLPGRWHIGA